MTNYPALIIYTITAVMVIVCLMMRALAHETLRAERAEAALIRAEARVLQAIAELAAVEVIG